MAHRPSPETTAIETIAAESEKFTSPLLFVHGLWVTAAVWRRFMGYCAHRGWNCHALSLPGRGDRSDAEGGSESRLADFADAVARAAASFETRPVLIGHDLGGLLVLANQTAARAVVALAPLLPESIDLVTRSLLRGWRTKIDLWQARPVTPSYGSSRDDYLCGAEQLGFLVPESSRFLRQVGSQARALDLGARVPTLIVGAQQDRFARPGPLQQLATQLDADFALVTDATHALPWDRGWDRTMAIVHRWLIHSLGEELLIAPEEEEDD